mmetsp:Transcript_17493/g.38119  ORF Transcript_17493/g.38119 Transcript_17493/m.38119 type:complete len:263 (-) Transcript_17493:148-936(-)|eukprot:CAMPEP_0118936640 /NCGR_PEP_ID=MMETSP1169-20130426/19789_1 /TAXON_ID=36882 /ORGANISM="Pyramimonas obovata, Strain CCMP722" /LENGTH=262 /DNA_ID=CAMNT_0006879963 /DNA_START=87 /DNA_END=875 /DNA_ORIENTATION=-
MGSLRVVLLLVCVLSVGSSTIESLCASSGQASSGEAERKKVVVLIGLEGSGHHPVEKVLEDSLDLKTYHCPSEVVEGHIGFDGKFLEFVRSQDYTVFGQVSFPEKRPHGRLVETAHPSLLSMVCLNVTGEIDLRFVYLRRNPTDSVCSAIRRYAKERDEEEIQTYTKVAVDSLMYISSVLRHPAVSHRVIDFAESIQDRSKMSDALQYALEGIVSHDDIEHALGEPVGSGPHHGSECPHREYIEETLKRASAFLEDWMIPEE